MIKTRSLAMLPKFLPVSPERSCIVSCSQTHGNRKQLLANRAERSQTFLCLCKAQKARHDLLQVAIICMLNVYDTVRSMLPLCDMMDTVA
eukprot:3678961-Amphidinium_carterae.1